MFRFWGRDDDGDDDDDVNNDDDEDDDNGENESVFDFMKYRMVYGGIWFIGD